MVLEINDSRELQELPKLPIPDILTDLDNKQSRFIVCCSNLLYCFTKIVTNNYFKLYDIFLVICLLPDLVLSALPINNYILTYQAILLGLITFNSFLKVIGLNKEYINDRLNIFDIIYIGCGWCIYGYPAISVFRLLFIFKIIKTFRLIRKFKKIRYKLYRFLFILSEVYNEFTYDGTAFWIFILTYIVTHIYAISSQILFSENLPELFGNYNKSMFTLIRFSTSQEWDDILKVMEIYGNEYFFFFLSFYIIIIVGFFNGLIVVFGNAFTNDKSYEKMVQKEDNLYYEEIKKKPPIEDDKEDIQEQLNELKYTINLIYDKLHVDNVNNLTMIPIRELRDNTDNTDMFGRLP